MPGLNAIVGFSLKLDDKQRQIDSALTLMDYDSTYTHARLYGNSNVGIYFSGYPAYPYYKTEIGDKYLVIEGAIYNKSDDTIKKELTAILEQLIKTPGKTNPLTNFIRETDGEYIVYYIDPVISTILIFNDAMGRLPAYCYFDSNQFLLGRSMKFILGCAPEIEFSDWGLIEYFLYSAPLGDHTVFKNVYRLRPYTLLTINYAQGKVDQEILYRYNFDDRWEDKPLANYVKDLHDLFIESVATRAARFKDKKQILSLSGGLDSRTNLMGLLKVGVEFQTITYNDHYNQLGRDIPVVKQLIESYQLKSKIIQLGPETIAGMERAVFLKDGSGLMGTMGSILESMELIRKEYGPDMVYYVGDEGNYTTAPRYGGGRIKSIPALVKMIFAKNSLSAYSIEEVAGLFGKSGKLICDHLCEYFSQYQEKNNVHKMDRFFYWERSFKFTMENQDRSRLYFWPLAPHYGIKYAPYALKIENRFLAGWKVYIGLLASLDKKSIKFKYSNFGLPLDSSLLGPYLYLRGIATTNEKLRRRLLVVLRLIRNPQRIGLKKEEYDYIDQIRNHIRELTVKNNRLNSVLDTSRLNAILAEEGYLYRLYVAANMIKFIDLVKNKTI